MADAGGSKSGDHSSGEYSGIVHQADVGKSGKASDMAIVISSGKNIQADRIARREAKKKEKDKK